MTLITIILVMYVLVVLAFTIGYYRIIEQKPIPSPSQRPISVVICFRNEEANVDALFSSLQQQTYPHESFEVIAVNDHSTDSTLAKLRSLQQQLPNLTVIDLPPEELGKKMALTRGVNTALSEYIATTDADSVVPPQWLETINSGFANRAQLVCGPVAYHASTFFERLAAVEFGSLVASSIGAAGLHMPILCNGANLAYTKELFLDANLDSDDTPSGDDVFLLHYAKSYKKKIDFFTGKDFLVLTAPDTSPRDFINRRKRWGSKTKFYSDTATKLAALLVLLANILIVALLVASAINPPVFRTFVILFGVKTIAESGLVGIHFRVCNVRQWAPYFWMCTIIYPFYIVVTALGCFRSNFIWKERKYR